MPQQQYDNTNTAVLFINDRRTNDNQPTRQGHLTIECPHCQQLSEFWLSAWDRVTNMGDTISMALNIKEDQQRGGGRQPMRSNSRSNFPRNAPQRSQPQQQNRGFTQAQQNFYGGGNDRPWGQQARSQPQRQQPQGMPPPPGRRPQQPMQPTQAPYDNDPMFDQDGNPL